MSNIKVLSGSPIPGNDPVPQVIDHLRYRLAQAERGEIRAIATACLLERGEISTGWQANNQIWPLVGAVAWLNHRMLAGD